MENNKDMKKLTVKITKHILSGWYSGMLGLEFEVYDAPNERFGDTDYYLVETFNNEDCRKLIGKQDCVIITNMKKIKKTDLQKIHDVACSTWKDKIKEIAKREIFGDTVELTQSEINEMFSAANTKQTEVLESVFGKQQKELDFRSNQIDHEVDGMQVFGTGEAKIWESIISLGSSLTDDSKKDCLWLNEDYDYQIIGGNKLKITRK